MARSDIRGWVKLHPVTSFFVLTRFPHGFTSAAPQILLALLTMLTIFFYAFFYTWVYNTTRSLIKLDHLALRDKGHEAPPWHPQHHQHRYQIVLKQGTP